MLSKFSVNKSYTVVVAVIIILILGIISFMNLQTDLLPSLDLPFLVIMTNYPGASPEEIELIITRPIEQVVATTSNIKNINSVSRENSSMVIMEFDNSVNMDSAIIEINSKLDLIKDNWEDTVSSPMIIKINPDMLPIMITAVDIEETDVFEISKFTEENLIPELESVPGVASVEGEGLLEEEIQVLINPEKIEELNREILNKVDSQLADAERELLNAKGEIEEGKSKLNQEEQSNLDQIEEGQKALSTGKEEISKAETEMEKGLSELNRNKGEINLGLIEVEKQERRLDLIEEILPLNIGPLGEKGKDFIEESRGEILEQKSKLKDGLNLIEEKTRDIENGKLEIIRSKNEIDRKEEELAQGKTLLITEMNKAREELDKGEIQINEKLSELEDSKEEAFKEALLDGVISVDMVSGILAAQNFNMPAGYITEDNIDYLVKVGDQIDNIEEMRELLLFDTGEDVIGKIRLEDVADVEYTDNSDETYAKINGNNGVVLNFQKQSNYSTVEVTNNIRDKMEELSKENKDLSFTNLMDQGIYIDIIVESVLKNIIFGGILAILILVLFLRDIKPTFVIAVSIPISIIFAIAMMYFTNVTINIISLAGLALGVGMLVDNSIVVIENIYRLRNEGVSARDAAIEGAREVSGAILASTITTACVFLPIVFTQGISREIFTDMGLTIGYSLFASLIVALTLVPSMAAKTLANTEEKESKVFNKIVNTYEKILTWSLNHKGIILTSVILLLMISGYFAYSMGTSFIPDMEEPQMSLSLEMPDDSTFEESTKMADKVVDRIIDIEGIEAVGAIKGGTIEGMGSLDDDSVSIYIILDEESTISNNTIKKEIEESTKDLEVNISIDSSNMDMTAFGGSGIEVLIKGRDLDQLQEIAGEIFNIVENIEGTKDVEIDIEDGPDETRITVDKEKAMENKLTVAQIYQEVSTILSEGKTATTLTVKNKDYPVIVLHGESEDINRENLMDISIKTEEDKEVVLGDIVDISEAKGLSAIKRESQERYISVNTSIDSDYNIGLVSRDLEKELEDYQIREGYSIDISGENETIKESLEDLIKMLLLAIVLIYLIMVAQFQSLLSPFIIMFTIPLAFTGGLLALAVTGNNISIISMLGFLVLSGVVVNNGIVFVDYTNQLISKEIPKNEALVLAGKTRLRPILMTAITTILGLSTLSIGVGVGSEMLQPLAIVAIGGLIYSTILTLVVVPSIYDLFHK